MGKATPIAQKYQTPAAELYRERLRALVEGRDPPTELPKRAPVPAPMVAPHQAPASSGGPGGFGGPALASGGGGHAGGSALEPLPGETQEQYIARQRRLNEEARRRMQAKFGGSGGARMQGFGSDPDYDPNRGAFGGVGGGAQDLGAEILGAVGRIGSTVQVRAWVFGGGWVVLDCCVPDDRLGLLLAGPQIQKTNATTRLLLATYNTGAAAGGAAGAAAQGGAGGRPGRGARGGAGPGAAA